MALENRTELPVAMGFSNLLISPGIQITQITIREQENGHIYRGNLKFIDHVEHGIKGENDWEAKPGKQEHVIAGIKYLFDVNPLYPDKVPFWGKDHFTLSPSIDDGFRHMIMHALVFYNPDLPNAD